GAFVVEGWKLVGEAIAAGMALEAVFVEPDGAARVDAGVDAAAVPVHVVEASVLAGALDTKTPQGIAAIARTPVVPVDVLDATAGPVLVLVGVADPGNAGTLLRTAEAAGCS